MSLFNPKPPTVVKARPTPTQASFLGPGNPSFGPGSSLFKRKPTPVIWQSNRNGLAKPSLIGNV
jgi:hypothetical protein